jgi:hypothetical protein
MSKVSGNTSNIFNPIVIILPQYKIKIVIGGPKCLSQLKTP